MNKPDSVSRPKPGFSVAPSPLNSVKLELAVIMAIGVVLWFLTDRMVMNRGIQLALMAGYGTGGMVWVVMRTRRVLAVLRRDSERQD